MQKFDKLKLFITEMNTHETISVICIQETWGHNGIDMDSFSLPNYSLVNENRRLSNHEGLIIYVHDNFSFKVLNKDMHITNTSKLFESLIVETWRNNCKYQKYIIGSITDCHHMTMTMTMKISLFDINHLNTMIRKNKAEKNNVVNEQETIQDNIKCRYRRPTP